MKEDLLRTGYVMISRALLMKMYEGKRAASSDEEAFLRILIHVNYRRTVVWYNGVQITCERGESLITFLGWADILGWTRAHTRRYFASCFQEGLIEQVPGACPSHIRIPGYDAWTGHPAGGSAGAPAAKVIPEQQMNEAIQRFIDRYSEVTHLPAESKERLRPLWKKLSTLERQKAFDSIEDYYYGLSNINYCYQAAKYLEYKAFNKEND